MNAHAPLPDAQEARDNAAFAAILAALSRPGTVHRLPMPGPAPIVEALLDRECRAWADTLETETLIRRTGATIVPSELAGHVFLSLDAPAALDRLARVTTGDALYPDEGATVIAPALIGEGMELRLTGPGIEGETRLRVGGLHPGLWLLRAALCGYPLGIELVLVDGDSVAAIPRSTTVEVL
jgi:alpha-D-ribose 1-methylphosphonate 5-triphosphate synthase subunit PhnH